MDKPRFMAGRNLAMKVPPHEYEPTLRFYRNVLGLRELAVPRQSAVESTRFEFGDKMLWIDKVAGLSQAEIWLEVLADDVDAAAEYLAQHDCVRRDEIEPLPAGFRGFWVASPANIIHLVTAPGED